MLNPTAFYASSSASTSANSSVESVVSPNNLNIRHMEIDKSYFDALANGFELMPDDKLEKGEVRKITGNERVAVAACPETGKQIFLERNSLTDHFILEGSNLDECTCPGTLTHNRFITESDGMPDSTRRKVETLLTRQILSRFSDQPNKTARLLSLGSGGCLQDLILIAKLVKSGMRKIDLTLVETNPMWNAAYRDLDYLFEKLKAAYGDSLKLDYRKVNRITEVDTQASFDVMYAIDLEEYSAYLDYSGRRPKWHGLAGNFDKNPYFSGTDLIRAAALLNLEEGALAVISRGEDIVGLTSGIDGTCYKAFQPLFQFQEALDLEQIDLYYLNADINNLIFNLPYFSQANKPLIINQHIVQEEDREGVERCLERYRIPYEFLDEAETIQRIADAEVQVLIVDYTIFDPKKGETALFGFSEAMQKPNVFMIRADWTNSRAEHFDFKLYSAALDKRLNALLAQKDAKSLIEADFEIKDPSSPILLGSVPRKTTCLKDYLVQIAFNTRDLDKSNAILEALESNDPAILKNALGKQIFDQIHLSQAEKNLSKLNIFNC